MFYNSKVRIVIVFLVHMEMMRFHKTHYIEIWHWFFALLWIKNSIFCSMNALNFHFAFLPNVKRLNLHFWHWKPSIQFPLPPATYTCMRIGVRLTLSLPERCTFSRTWWMEFSAVLLVNVPDKIWQIQSYGSEG